MFVWRMSKWPMSDIMQNILRFCDEKQTWLTNSPSTSIVKIFQNKWNIVPFIDLVMQILDEDRHYVANNMVKLVDIVRPHFNDIWGEEQHLIAPMDEVKAYSNMLACASYDWKQLKACVGVLLRDEAVGYKLFFRFINKIGELTKSKHTAIDHAFRNTHERAVLLMSAANSPQQDNNDVMWLDSISDDFNHTEYCTHKIIVKKASEMTDVSRGFDGTALGGLLYGSPPYVSGRGGGGHKGTQGPGRLTPLKGARSERKQKVDAWMKECTSRLKPSFAIVFGSGGKYCAAFHSKDMKCVGTDSKGKCAKGQFQRSHVCVCGGNHAMYACKKIWQ